MRIVGMPIVNMKTMDVRIMDRIREHFKSKKFIFLFAIIANLISIILFRLLQPYPQIPYELCILPILSLLWGPVAILGFIISETIVLTIFYPQNSSFNFIFILLIFISNFAIWKLWYSILNKNGKELPNLRNFHNFFKLLIIYLAYFIMLLFLFSGFSGLIISNLNGFAFVELRDFLIQSVPTSIFLTIFSLYIVNYYSVPLISPQIQFKEILPKNAYELFLISFLILGLYLTFSSINEYSLLLGLVEILLFVGYLLKPYDDSKIKGELKISLFNKIYMPLFLIIVTLVLLVSLICLYVDYTSFGLMHLDYINIGYLFFLILLIPILIYLFIIEKIVTKPIKRLSEILSKGISNREDFVEHKKNLKSIKINNEIKTLIDSLINMENDLVEYGQELMEVTAENERYETELKLASDIQNSMIPTNFEEFCNGVNDNSNEGEKAYENKFDLKLWGLMEAKHEVGGDFYDYFKIDEDNIGFVIGDVSGKGITASLIMVKAMTLIQDYVKQYDDLSKVFYEVNNLLCEDNAEEIFVTSWLGKLNMKTGELSFVNAGHNQPLIRLNDEENNSDVDIGEENNEPITEFEYMDTRPGLVLAGMEDMSYKTYTIKLGKNDALLLYTDGVTEANYNYEGFYGAERLKNILNQHKDDDLRIIIDSIEKDLLEFCKHESRFDDTTLLIIRLE